MDLTRLRLGLNYLNKHKFDRKFPNCFDLKCSCRPSNEDPAYFLLHCPHYTDISRLLLNEISSTDKPIIYLPDTKLVEVFVYGKLSLILMKNNRTLNKTF